MTSEKLEYDSAIGGHIVLPEHIETYRYAAAHADEIKNLLSSIQNPTSNKLIFQTLPKHMRRRAMSHHPKRLPRRYRGIHKSQMSKAGNPQQTKRPSRKYRRKPSNLLKEYVRRQQKYTWLETHIWHAKRFHMIPKWGYKLPLSSCDKSYRSCYRATTNHCLLQDISYFGCIEIQGNLEIIRKKFQHLTNSKCGLGICAKAYTTGKREGSIHLFRSNQYPFGALGKVNFIWKSEKEELTENRILWIFIHPSMYNEVLEEVIKIFELISLKTIKVPIKDDDNDKMEVDLLETTKKKLNKNEDKKNTQLKFMTKTFAYSRTPKYENKFSGILLTELKDTMNRFRLTGPLSQSVLTKALKPKKFTNNELENWFKSEMENSVNLEAHSVQTNYWNNMKNIKSPGELIPNIILALNIEDPRLNRPNKRTKALPENSIINDNKVYYEFPDSLSHSAIWNFDLRNSLAEKMISTNEFCTLRNKNCLVPGESCEFENNLQPVPILLIQRPGSQYNQYKKLGYGCGWDVIIPSGYGISIWLSLIMWGAKSGGLREIRTISKESGNDEFLPDTISGLKEFGERYMVLKDKYFRLPPNKRCNYKKLAICSPFKVHFNQLIKEWSLVDHKYYILRDKEILQQILKCFLRNQSLPFVEKGCLIQISLKMKTRGNPGDFSLICLPKSLDFRTNLKRLMKYSNEPVFVEPLRLDDKEDERKLLKKEHKKLLKRLRSKRVREKRRKQETSELKVKIRPAGTVNLVKEQFKKMCELWLTTNPITIRNQCSREVFGYMTISDFSLIEATVTGIGYITIEGLEKLMKLHNEKRADKMLVLVRGTKSRNYRFANFKINCNL